MKHNKVPAVFLDRDGTIITERGYLKSPNKIRFYPTAIEGLKKLTQSGFKLIVITNQSGVGRGYFSEKTLSQIHQRFKTLLLQHKVKISAIYYCPHLPTDACSCRKPKTKLVDLASKEHHINLSKSYMVGDQIRDVELGFNMGGKSVLVLTGGGKQSRKNFKKSHPHVSKNLFSASEWIIKDARKV